MYNVSPLISRSLLGSKIVFASPTAWGKEGRHTWNGVKDGNQLVLKTIDYLRLFFQKQPIRSDCFGEIQPSVTDYWTAQYRGGPNAKCGSCGLGGWSFDCVQIDLRYPKHCQKIICPHEAKAVKILYVLVQTKPFNTHQYPIYKNSKSAAHREVAGIHPTYRFR